MAVDDLTSVNVADSVLVEFIERVAVAGGSDIRVSQGDRGWYVTYRPPFTRDIKEDGALVIEEDTEPVKMYATPYSAKCCQGCASIRACADKGPAWTYCGGKLYTRDFCSPQQIAEASCDGDINKCGNACHGGKNGC